MIFDFVLISIRFFVECRRKNSIVKWKSFFKQFLFLSILVRLIKNIFLFEIRLSLWMNLMSRFIVINLRELYDWKTKKFNRKKKTKNLNLIKVDEIREIVFSKKTKVENIDVEFVDNSTEIDSIVIEINEFFMNKKEAQKRKLRYRKKSKIEHDFSAEMKDWSMTIEDWNQL